MTTINVTTTLAVEVCCNCGVQFAMPEDYQERRRKKHDEFYCPAGHSQHYTGQTEEAKLRDRLRRAEEREQSQLDRRIGAERALLTEKQQRGKVKAKLTRVLTRVEHGVCPHCNRSFENLQRHMETKH